MASKKLNRDKGMGAIFYSESKKLWVARIELPARNGNRRRKEITAKTQQLLLEKMRAPLTSFHMAGDLPTSSTRLDKYLEQWFVQVAQKRVRPNTAAGYHSVLWNHVIPEIGHYRLDKITPAVLRRVHTRITSTPKDSQHPEKGCLSPTYALNAHRVLAKALEDAVRDGLIPRNPAKMMDAPRKAHTHLEILTAQEAVEVLRWTIPAFERTNIDYDPFPMIWAVHLLTGMRRGEVIGLEWSRVSATIDVSWQLQRITDPSTLPSDYPHRHLANGIYLVPTKSVAGTRIIPLVEPLKTMFDMHQTCAPRNRWGLVFTTPEDLPFDPDTVSKRWTKVLAASDVTDKHVRLHDLRHTTVDLLLEAGVDPDVVKEIAGHSSWLTTEDYKNPRKLVRREDAMKRLSAHLGQLTA